MKQPNPKPDNMVYLRDEMHDKITSTLDRFRIQAMKELLDSVGGPCSYYDFVFSRYDDNMRGVSGVPARERKLLLGSTTTPIFILAIPTDVVGVSNNHYAISRRATPMPDMYDVRNSFTHVDLTLNLPDMRLGDGLSYYPIVLSPGMENFEALSQKAQALATISRRLKYYSALTAHVLRVVGTTTKLRTVWPQILPFVPAESRHAMSKRSRKAWPVAILRDIVDANTTQEAVEADLAAIVANTVHASMLPGTGETELMAGYNPVVGNIALERIGSVTAERRQPFSKPDSYPNYKSDLY